MGLQERDEPRGCEQWVTASGPPRILYGGAVALGDLAVLQFQEDRDAFAPPLADLLEPVGRGTAK